MFIGVQGLGFRLIEFWVIGLWVIGFPWALQGFGRLGGFRCFLGRLRALELWAQGVLVILVFLGGIRVCTFRGGLGL